VPSPSSVLGAQPDVRSRQADFRQARAVGLLAGDERRPARRRTLLAVLVGGPDARLCCSMLILGIILFGMVVGAGAQLILGRSHQGIDWTIAIVAGLVGSFIGGLAISLLSGDGLDLRPSGIIGSLAGAVVATAAWRWWEDRHKPTPADRAAKRSGDPRKANPR
jgi:uncharacterized membrane protein YeaQ/YmgE (transglycosylase-associated protein family)